MKSTSLITLAVTAALVFLPVDLDVQASIFVAAGLLAILFSDYANEPKSLSIGADVVPFPTSSDRVVLGQVA